MNVEKRGVRKRVYFSKSTIDAILKISCNKINIAYVMCGCTTQKDKYLLNYALKGGGISYEKAANILKKFIDNCQNLYKTIITYKCHEGFKVECGDDTI